MTCSACNAVVPDDDLFCEICGGRLGAGETQAVTTVSSGCSCGAVVEDVDEDGFCLCCGKRVRRPASDHIEEEISPRFAAVSDRGLHHDRNEDRFALVQHGDGYGLVICDGVSSTSQSETASALVASKVADAIAMALEGEVDLDTTEMLREAVHLASLQLQERTAAGRNDNTPSTTIVAALVQGDAITVGWAGDSRAYWIDRTGATLLTHDHSWVNEVLATGEVSEEEARTSPQAHAITRWIGADAGSEAEPETVHMTVSREGLLLLCTDGLWNYVDDEASLAELVRAAGEDDGKVLAVARWLIEHAKERGGRDNITVAALRCGSPERGSTAQTLESAEPTTAILRKESREAPYAESVQG